jgi:hypothetical protein
MNIPSSCGNSGMDKHAAVVAPSGRTLEFGFIAQSNAQWRNEY